MSDVINILNRTGHVDESPRFEVYSKVIIHVSDETTYEAGNDNGRVLEIDNPFGSQQMANDLLAKLQGYRYQPYTASGAILDPAAEIGDAANVGGVYGGIFKRNRNFGRLMKADISAPHDEEINHEYKFETPQERKFERELNDVKASLIIASDNIMAQVLKKEDGDTSSFGWRLTSDAHRWFANGEEVASIKASGVFIKGVIEAEAGGKIGNFNISDTAIWNGISSFNGSGSTGVYLGTNGIQLGQSFKVTPSGAVTATNLSVDTLYIGGTAISAATLNSRANSAYASTSSGGYCYNGATYGANYNAATAYGAQGPTYFNAGQIRARNTLIGGSLVSEGSASISGNTTLLGGFNFGNYAVSWQSKTVVIGITTGSTKINNIPVITSVSHTLTAPSFFTLSGNSLRLPAATSSLV